MDTATNSCREFSQCFLVSAEIIHNQVDPALWPSWQHVFQPKGTARFSRFCGKSFPDCFAGAWIEGTKPLQGAVTFVAIRTKTGTSAPCFTATGDSLQWSHFVKAHHLSPTGTVAVDLNYSVFFTSNSGSLLSHQVWPVRKRRP